MTVLADRTADAPAVPDLVLGRPLGAAVGITVNRNAVPFDPRPPMVSSGVRIGTPALAARGFDAEDFAEVADVIAAALRPSVSEQQLAGLRERVARLAGRHPLYPELMEAGR